MNGGLHNEANFKKLKVLIKFCASSVCMSEEQSREFVDLVLEPYEKETLRRLLNNHDYQWTVNELVEAVPASYNTVRRFLDELFDYEIIYYQKKGNYRLVQYNTLNRYHRIITGMFSADTGSLKKLAEDYVSVFNEQVEEDVADKVVSIILFGSVARGTADKDSDIDVLLLTGDDKGKDLVEMWAIQIRNEIDRFGDVVPVVESLREFRNKYSHGKRFENNVVQDGITLYGEDLNEAIQKSA